MLPEAASLSSPVVQFPGKAEAGGAAAGAGRCSQGARTHMDPQKPSHALPRLNKALWSLHQQQALSGLCVLLMVSMGSAPKPSCSEAKSAQPCAHPAAPGKRGSDNRIGSCNACTLPWAGSGSEQRRSRSQTRMEPLSTQEVSPFPQQSSATEGHSWEVPAIPEPQRAPQELSPNSSNMFLSSQKPGAATVLLLSPGVQVMAQLHRAAGTQPHSKECWGKQRMPQLRGLRMRTMISCVIPSSSGKHNPLLGAVTQHQ